MAILDKIKGAASAAGEMASDTVEVAKLKTKIQTEKKGREDSMQQIGQLLFDKMTAGEVPEEVKTFLPDEIEGLIGKIQEHNKTIEGLKEEIERVKND